MTSKAVLNDFIQVKTAHTQICSHILCLSVSKNTNRRHLDLFEPACCNISTKFSSCYLEEFTSRCVKMLDIYQLICHFENTGPEFNSNTLLLTRGPVWFNFVMLKKNEVICHLDSSAFINPGFRSCKSHRHASSRSLRLSVGSGERPAERWRRRRRGDDGQTRRRAKLLWSESVQQRKNSPWWGLAHLHVCVSLTVIHLNI